MDSMTAMNIYQHVIGSMHKADHTLDLMFLRVQTDSDLRVWSMISCPLSLQVCKLGVLLDSALSWYSQIVAMSRSAFNHFRLFCPALPIPRQDLLQDVGAGTGDLPLVQCCLCGAGLEPDLESPVSSEHSIQTGGGCKQV